MVRAFLKLGQKTMSEDSCLISIILEGFCLKDWTLVGGIILSLQEFNAESLMTVVLAIKVLEKGVHHKRV
jgi:hypothetical protein